MCGVVSVLHATPFLLVERSPWGWGVGCGVGCLGMGGGVVCDVTGGIWQGGGWVRLLCGCLQQVMGTSIVGGEWGMLCSLGPMRGGVGVGWGGKSGV